MKQTLFNFFSRFFNGLFSKTGIVTRIDENTESEIIDFLYANQLPPGKLISGSKSAYSRLFPNDLVLFNANIFIEERGKIWHGDINLTKQKNILEQIKENFGVDVYVLREMDGRFGLENNPKFKRDATWNTKTGLNKKYLEYFDNETLTLKEKYRKK